MIRAVWRAVRMRPGPSLLTALVVAASVSAVAGALAVDAALPDAGPDADARLAHDCAHGLLLGFSALVALAVVVIVMNAFATSLRRRTRTLALLRATGTGPAPVALVILLQATAIGLLGSALGMLGGIGTIRLLDAGLASRGAPLDGLSAAPHPAAVALGLLVALLGALPPTIGAALTPPAGAADGAADSHPLSARSTAGAISGLLGAVGVGLAWRAGDLPHREALLAGAAGLLLLGLLIALPAALRPLIALLGLPARSTASGGLAVRHLAAAPRHGAALAAAPLFAAAAVCVAVPLAASLRASGTAPGYLDTVLSALPAMLAGLAVLAGICAAGALAASISRRAAEAELLRAVGQGRGQGVGQFLCEALLAGAGGVVLGAAYGLLLAGALGAVLADRGLTGTVVPWMQLLVPALVGCAVGVLTALLPALRAMRPSPDASCAVTD